MWFFLLTFCESKHSQRETQPRMMVSLWIGYHGRALALPPGLPSHLELPVSMASRSRCSATSWKVMAGVRIGLRLLSVTGIITFFMKSQGSHYCSSVLGLIILGLPQWSSISTPTIILLLETMYKICLRCLFLMDASSGTTPVRLPIANKIALTLFGMFAFSLFRRILAHSLL